ncbi:MAG: putative porin [Bacteroidota bacterium]
MKNIITYALLFLLYSSVTQAQHEGIERHFSNWNLKYSPDSIDSHYAQDTLLKSFHLYENIYKQSIHGGMLAGNNGQAFLAYDYFARPALPGFIFRKPFTTYFSNSHDMVYFDARKPFTIFGFNSGPNGYEDVKGTFTINANPFLNAGLQYHSVKTEGSFVNSGSKNKDFKLWQSYTGKRYQNHFNLVINNQSAQEFGGIVSDTAYANGTRVDNLTVNLTEASSEQKNQSLYFAHEYRIGNMSRDTIYREEDTVLQLHYHGNISIYQDIHFERNWRIYRDIPGGFYDDIYRDSAATYDSVALMKGTHQAGLQFFGNKDSIQTYRAFAGIMSEAKRFHLPSGYEVIQNHFMKLYVKDNSHNSINYSAEAKYGLAGRRQSDFHSNLQFAWMPDSLQQFIISNTIRHETANYFYENYASNHFQWEQSFINEKTAKTCVKYNNKKYHFNLRINHAYLQDPVYINADGIPAQYNTNGNTYNFGIGKTFYAGAFGLKTDVIYQQSSLDSVIRLPEILGYAGLFFESDLFDHHMRFRTGVDGRYISNYKSCTYIPATGFFVPATNKTLAEDLMLDAYLSFKVKRFRAFIRYNNISGNFLHDASWSMLHYPARPSALSFGFTWEFYD